MSGRATRFALALLCAGCALQHYDPQALDPARTEAQFVTRDPADPKLRDALARHGIEVGQWPLPQWDLAALAALAYELRADLDVARAERASAEAARESARAAPNPGLDLASEHHSVGGSKGSPWTFGLALDLPLTGASRRAARGDLADARAREARWLMAQRAWQVRSEVRDAYAAWHFARQSAEATEAELTLRRRETSLLEKRLALGAVAGSEPARARQREAETARQQRTASQAGQRARGELARAVGLAPEVFDGLRLAAPGDDLRQTARNALLQRAALHDRLDVRAALERYAASEAALQLEIARQIPELSIRPGYAWDQGDNRWSLGLSMLLPLFDRNAGPISEARARRDAEAARFLALQAKAIAELDAALQLAQAARAEVDAARAMQMEEAQISARVERRFAAGAADRIEQVGALIAAASARRRVIDARAADRKALATLEDAVQRPLDEVPAAAEERPGLARSDTR